VFFLGLVTVSNAQTYLWPALDGQGNLNTRVTQDYSEYNGIGNSRYHTGIDIGANPQGATNNTVRATAAGTIHAIKYHPDPWGNALMINHGSGIYSLYGHLASFSQSWVFGQSVTRGQQLGVMGITGTSTGIHLHFEIKQDGSWGPGYTNDLPDGYNYRDPRIYISPYSETNITPIVVRVISTTNVNLRTGPGPTYTILGVEPPSSRVQLQPNQKFVAFRQNSDWYHIYLPNANGTVSGWSIRTSALSEDPSFGQIRVRNTSGLGLNVRTGPGTSYPIVRTVNDLANLKIWDEQRFAVIDQATVSGVTWYKIDLPTLAAQSTGWVSGDWVDYFPPAIAIASGLSISSKLVMDSDFIYWAEEAGTIPYYQDDTTGVVRKIGKNGGTITTLASRLNHPDAVLVDNSFVYWIERGSWPNSNGTIKKVPKNGGTIITLASGLNYPQGPSTIDATNVYFGDPCSIKKIGISGGQVTTIATDVCWGPGALSVDATGNLFYILVSGLTTTWGLKKVSVNGGTVTTLATVSTSYNATVLDPSYVYWTEQGTPAYGYPVPGAGVVKKVAKTGGVVTLLASGLNAPTEMVLDPSSSFLYWVNNGTWTNGVYNANTGSIQRISTAGGMITTLAENLNMPFSIQVDAFHIYWSEVSSAGVAFIKRMPIIIVGVAQSTEIPKEFGLSQNYPNPFNLSTTITFTLPSKSFVSLKVFDALGREVSSLLAEELTVGTYSQKWNAAGLASGVYFYRLQAGNFVETRKLLLLR